MDKGTLEDIVAQILERDEVSATDSLEELGWDSLASLAFIAEIDERFGIQVDADQLVNTKSVGDLNILLSDLK